MSYVYNKPQKGKTKPYINQSTLTLGISLFNSFPHMPPIGFRIHKAPFGNRFPIYQMHRLISFV